MATALIEVKSVLVGDGGGGPRLGTVQLRLASERITTRELIARTVETQIREMTDHRRMVAAEARTALDRQYLDRREIEQQASLGRIKMPSQAALKQSPDIDVSAEVERACRAFERGVFRVLIDGRAAEDLETPLVLRDSARITFLRLIPLAGG